MHRPPVHILLDPRDRPPTPRPQQRPPRPLLARQQTRSRRQLRPPLLDPLHHRRLQLSHHHARVPGLHELRLGPVSGAARCYAAGLVGSC